ncbi:DUF1501 domain-containing protein [Spirosoma radiotolerans]|uniref:Secretion system C-terminal sorting domain-containing protein n=1 Tax=Spirosoma radiotolerans TaxID=1379870 RepID=A0A0E3V8Z9_9BACT|nr:DUF1501 domain-containing protein [Spirosoma radiotolerans]AKD56716.1 hypothetical protein SD10_19240 [Spirosoma radiotolerans]
MKRRHFLQHAASSLILPVLIDGFGAKAFARPSSFVQSLINLADQTDRVLVIIQLQGGNDGLNMVIPLDQMGVYTAPNFRGNIAIPEAKALRLKNFSQTGLHPAMTGMQQLFNDGKLSIIQGVSYPTPNFSHFRASDIWMTAVDSTQTAASGWAGRYLDKQYPGFPDSYPTAKMPDPPAIQIGYVTATSLLGPTDSMAIVLQDPDTFARLVGDTPKNPLASQSGYAGQQIDYIRQQQASSVSYASQIKTAAGKGKNLAAYPATNSLAAQLKIIARLMSGGLQTKVYYVTLGGFDNHANQVDATDTTTGTHANLLRTLSDAVLAFQTDLAQLKLEDRVVGMTFSEFGRRAISNGSRGTDHGTSAPMFVFGTAIKSPMVGKNPNLSDLDNNNLKMQTDFRQVYAAILTDWFGTDASTETAAILRDFPVAPVFRAPQVVTAIDPTETATRLYPNPASGEVVLESDWLMKGLKSAQVSDMQGRLMPLNPVQSTPGSVRFNVGNLPVGNYVLQVETGQGLLTKRISVVRY